jgi:hypothetical protein
MFVFIFTLFCPGDYNAVKTALTELLDFQNIDEHFSQ